MLAASDPVAVLLAAFGADGKGPYGKPKAGDVLDQIATQHAKGMTPAAIADHHGLPEASVHIALQLKGHVPGETSKLDVPKPEPAAASADAGSDAWFDSLKKVSGALGSNPGGTYVDPQGARWYVKRYHDPTQGASEQTANAIYRALGAPVPTSVLNADGRFATKWIDGAQGTLQDVGLTPDRANKVLDHFAADVLTMNWDAVGTGLDNGLVLPDGSVARVDQGGTLLHRAQGERKPTALLHDIGEWDTLRTKNPYYAKVFKAAGVANADALGARVVQQIDAITTARPKDGWQGFVDRAVPQAPAAYRRTVGEMLDVRHAKLVEKAAALRQTLHLHQLGWCVSCGVPSLDCLSLAAPGPDRPAPHVHRLGWCVTCAVPASACRVDLAAFGPDGKGPYGKPLAGDVLDQIAAKHEAGQSPEAIAAAHGLPVASVHKAFAVKGLTPHAAGATVPKAGPPAVPADLPDDVFTSIAFQAGATPAVQAAVAAHVAAAEAVATPANTQPRAWPLADDAVRVAVPALATPTLTADDRKVVRQYTGDDFDYVNREIIAAGKSGTPLRPVVQQFADALTAAIAKAPPPPADFVVWRGVTRQTLLDAMQPGGVITLHGFQSTSIKPEVAYHYATIHHQFDPPTGMKYEDQTELRKAWAAKYPGGVAAEHFPVLEIRPTAGLQTGKFGTKENKAEAEFVLPPGRAYRVVGRKTVDLHVPDPMQFYGLPPGQRPMDVIQLEMVPTAEELAPARAPAPKKSGTAKTLTSLSLSDVPPEAPTAVNRFVQPAEGIAALVVNGVLTADGWAWVQRRIDDGDDPDGVAEDVARLVTGLDPSVAIEASAHAHRLGWCVTCAVPAYDCVQLAAFGPDGKGPYGKPAAGDVLHQIAAKHAAGHSHDAIAAAHGLPVTSVQKALKVMGQQGAKTAQKSAAALEAIAKNKAAWAEKKAQDAAHWQQAAVQAEAKAAAAKEPGSFNPIPGAAAAKAAAVIAPPIGLAPSEWNTLVDSAHHAQAMGQTPAEIAATQQLPASMVQQLLAATPAWATGLSKEEVAQVHAEATLQGKTPAAVALEQFGPPGSKSGGSSTEADTKFSEGGTGLVVVHSATPTAAEIAEAHPPGYEWKEKTSGPQKGKFAYFQDGVQVSAAYPKDDHAQAAKTLHYGTGPQGPPKPDEHAPDWPVAAGQTRQKGASYPKAVDAHYKTWAKGVTADQKVSISAYTGNGYGSLNKQLREGGLTETNKRYATRITAAIDAAPHPPPPDLVWRGIRVKNFGAGLGTGDVIDLHGFQSTSISPSFADHWAPNGTLVEIKPRKGAYVRPLSELPHEYEYLLPTGDSYRVAGRTKVSLEGHKREVIQLEQLTAAEAKAYHQKKGSA